ncbi:MAG: sensor histidine kinase [Myxococcota bacterium]
MRSWLTLTVFILSSAGPAPNETEPYDRVREALDRAKQVFSVDEDSWSRLTQEALVLAENSGDPDLLSYCHYALAEQYFEGRLPLMAEEHLLLAEACSTPDASLEVQFGLPSLLGSIRGLRGQFEQALALHRDARKVAERANHSAYLSRSKLLVAEDLLALERVEDALSMATEALDGAKNVGQPRLVAWAVRTRSKMLRRLDRHREALQFLREHPPPHAEDDDAEARDRALWLAEQARSALGDQRFESTLLAGRAARPELSTADDLTAWIEVLEVMAEARVNLGSYPAAFELVREARYARARQAEIERNRARRDAGSLKRIKEQELRIKELEQEAEKRRAEADQSRLTMMSLAVTMGLVLALLFALISRRRLDLRSARLLKEKNKLLTELIGEKETIHRELHHRVKNNLQLLGSMLNLQNRTLRDEAAADVISGLRNRILAMTLVHELLHREDMGSRVNALRYLQELGAHIIDAMGAEREELTISGDADIALNYRSAISVGLIVNELVTNAFEHAAAPSEGRGVQVSLRRAASGEEIVLTVSDQGIGMSEESEPRSGLTLVEDFVRQLRGHMHVDSSRGTSYTISFDLNHLNGMTDDSPRPGLALHPD